MGLFSSNYYKEGPGVEKNERKKKGFFAFFEIFFRNFWGLFTVSFVYSAISILSLGFANGLAKSGMTHVARSIGREKHSFLFQDFFETIKKNRKQSLALGIINVVFSALLALDIWFFWNYIKNSGEGFPLLQVIGLGISLALFIVATFIKYYIWTMTITFKLSIKQMIKNSFQFTFLNFGRNILVSIVFGFIYFSLYILVSSMNPGFLVIAIIILVCIVPGFKTLLVQFLVFPQIKKYMIDPYYAEHKGEDIEKRRALGLDISDDELGNEEKEESIFTDTVSSETDEDN